MTNAKNNTGAINLDLDGAALCIKPFAHRAHAPNACTTRVKGDIGMGLIWFIRPCTNRGAYSHPGTPKLGARAV